MSVWQCHHFINQFTSWYNLHLKTGYTMARIDWKYTNLSFRIIMLFKSSLMSSWKYNQTTVSSVHFLHCCPSTHYSICRSEWKVIQILMERGCLEVLVPGSGGLLINMVWIDMMSGPQKHSTYFSIYNMQHKIRNTLIRCKVAQILNSVFTFIECKL